MSKSTVAMLICVVLSLAAPVFGGEYFALFAFCLGGALLACGLLAMAGAFIYSIVCELVNGLRNLLSRKAA